MCNDALGVDVLVQPHDRCVAGQAWFNQLILNGSNGDSIQHYCLKLK